MKRYLTTLLLVVFVLGVSVYAASGSPPSQGSKKSKTAKKGKSGVPCPAAVKGPNATINDCEDTGCGPSLDPNLNRQKNIETDTDPPEDKDFSFLAELEDPVPGFKIGDTREKLQELGEGQMIRVVAY